MAAYLKTAATLLKLRIGIAIAASALAGMAAAQGAAPGWFRTIALALAVVGASGAAGASAPGSPSFASLACCLRWSFSSFLRFCSCSRLRFSKA